VPKSSSSSAGQLFLS